MAEINDRDFLLRRQYNDAARLNARIALHARFSTNPHGWQQFVFDALQAHLPENADLLECGCGSAALWRENQPRVSGAWRLTLTDFSPGMVEQARVALGSRPNTRCAQADIQALPYADATFDGVIANHMLYHVADLPGALANVRRVLRPGGRFFAATNGEAHMVEQWELALRANPQLVNWHAQVMRSFSLETGAAHLATVFEHVELLPYDDALVVTEVEPLVAYAASMDLIPEEKYDDFARLVADEMEANGGALRIGKQTGLFVAW